MQSTNSLNWFSKYMWLICLIIGGIGALTVILLMPHKHEIEHIAQPIYKLIIFFIIMLGISFFPKNVKWHYLLVLLSVLSILAFFIPKVAFWCFVGIPQNYPNWSNEVYSNIWLLLYPAIVMSICFAYRVGGGNAGKCFKIALVAVTALFSGFMDLMWNLVNFGCFPKDYPYAFHIIIFLGHVPTWQEVVLFFLAHIPFIILFLWLPFEKWFSFADKTLNELDSKADRSLTA
jgi:hypothetical protein